MSKQISTPEPENVGRQSEYGRIDGWLMEQNYDRNGNFIDRRLDTQLLRRNNSTSQPKGGGCPQPMQPQARDYQAVSEDSGNKVDDHSKPLCAEGQGGTRPRRMIFSRPEIYEQDNPGPRTIHVDPLAAEDQIIQMSLPASDDLEHELEEFSKLRRLGHFTDAFRLFEKRASHFLHNRYIRVQYGQCLFDAGELGLLAKLVKEWEPKRFSFSIDALDVLWMLLAREAEAVTLQLWERKSFLKAAMYMIRDKWPSLDSTEMALLACLCNQRVISPNGIFASKDWTDLCEHLLEEGMIWEFRDFVKWLVEVRDCGELVEQMCQRWLTDGGRPEKQDDSTLLALLDVLAMLSLTYMKKREEKTKAGSCFQLAHQYALELISRDETYVKSQPYLRWIMVNVLREDPEGSHSRDKITLNQTGRSVFLDKALTFPSSFPPIFVPIEGGTAEWAPKAHGVTRGLNETVRMVLRAAEDLGDQRFKAGCLIELMYRGAESPEVISSALMDHWSVTGDAKKKKTMHLFRYMLANTDSARERLRVDILADGQFNDSPFSQLTQFRILRALSSGENDKSRYTRLIEGELERRDALQEMLDSLSMAFSGEKKPEKTQNIKLHSKEASDSTTDGVIARHEGGNRQPQPRLETEQEAGRQALSIRAEYNIARDYEQAVDTMQTLRKKVTEEVNHMRRVQESLDSMLKESQIARESLQLEKENMKLALQQDEVPKPEGDGDNVKTANAHIRDEGGDGDTMDQGAIWTAKTEKSQAAAHKEQESPKSAPKQVELESVSDLEEYELGSRDGNDGKLIKEIDDLRKEKATLMEALELNDANIRLTQESLLESEAKLLCYKEERDAALTAMDGKGRSVVSNSLEDFIKQNERAKEKNARLGQPSFSQPHRPLEQTADPATQSQPGWTGAFFEPTGTYQGKQTI
ncbi:hypothetical protein PspLS_08437 [Pyricularia sp. CBS 133598]|nr:hypothetical protein PspLS_08437 [Pyricularia sp. CBS 133598]